MRYLLLSVLVVSLVGILTIPSAFAEVYYQEGHRLVPSFSIEYPDGWNSELETKWLSQNGYEGYPTFSISFMDRENLVMVSYYPDYGQKLSDSEERAGQIYDYNNLCNIVNLKEDGFTCKNFQVFHKVPFSYTTDRYPMITTVFKETHLLSDMSEKVTVTTASTIYVGNSIWDIVTNSDLNEFDKSKSTLFNIINSFRQPAQVTAAAIPTVVSEPAYPEMTITKGVGTTTPDPFPNGNGGCLIATAAFGSEMAPQVQFLRELRDNTVLQTESGTSFMAGFNQFYYSFSPAIADYERENPAFKEAVKITLTPLLSSLTLLQYADIDSESEMLGYGISIILLNIGMYFVAPTVLLSVCIRKIHKN